MHTEFTPTRPLHAHLHCPRHAVGVEAISAHTAAAGRPSGSHRGFLIPPRQRRQHCRFY